MEEKTEARFAEFFGQMLAMQDGIAALLAATPNKTRTAEAMRRVKSATSSSFLYALAKQPAFAAHATRLQAAYDQLHAGFAASLEKAAEDGEA